MQFFRKEIQMICSPKRNENPVWIFNNPPKRSFIWVEVFWPAFDRVQRQHTETLQMGEKCIFDFSGHG